MVFVADAIPPELQRIVEFLNGQMDPAEVLAVAAEVRQFVGQGLEALVPKVVGQTAAAQQAKGATRATGKRQWDEASFFADLEARCGRDEAAVARDILEWAIGAGLRIWWGRGQKDGSFVPFVDDPSGADRTVAVIYTYGRIEIPFQQMSREHAYATRHPFASEAKRLELLRRLNAVPGVNIPESTIARRPSIPLAALIAPKARQRFLDALDWPVAELRARGDTPP